MPISDTEAMRPADDRFPGADAGMGGAGGTPAVRDGSGAQKGFAAIGTAGVPPAIHRTAAAGDWILRSRWYLPRFDAPNLAQHIVFRLADSLPARIAADIAKLQGDDRLLAFDAALDAGHDKRDLAEPNIAGLVQTALLAFNGERYALIAWRVMPITFTCWRRSSPDTRSTGSRTPGNIRRESGQPSSGSHREVLGSGIFRPVYAR